MTIENFVGAAESEILEWKSSLSQLNRIIETISAFSNTKGGTIIIGMDGTGKTLGISIGKDTIEQMTNKIISNTEPKIYPDISVRKFEGKNLILIRVDKYPYDIVLAFGRPYKRVGKSTIKVSKDEYKRKILETHKKELYFDGQICPEATIKDIDENKIKKFIEKARRERKLHLNDLLSVKEILIRLKLMKNETLTNAAILLFAKNPQDFFIQQHFSEPFNPLLARMFFWIRYIEEIGTGTNKIIEWSKEWGLPEPEFKISGSSLFVTLRKSMLTEEYLKKLGLGERENRIVKLLLKQEKITSGEIQGIYSVTRDTANRYLKRLINLNIIERKGKGRFVYYVLREK